MGSESVRTAKWCWQDHRVLAASVYSIQHVFWAASYEANPQQRTVTSISVQLHVFE